jgi:hypothetical protein
MPDQARSNRRRSPRSQSTSHHRPPNARASQSSSAPSYAVSSATPTENTHNVGPSTGFQGSALHYPVPALPYAQRSGYRQYTMSAQPSLSMEHTPPPPFGYTHAYHHPGLPDSSMIPQNIHASYQPMLQPTASGYSYQSHSPDGVSATHNSFSNAVTPPIYPHLNTSPPIHSPSVQATPGQGNVHSQSYGSPGQFHSLPYPSPMSTPQYAYPAQPFSTSPPMYPGQYAPSPYARHFSSPQEPDRQGTWWYLPHSAAAVPSPQYENTAATYQGHYPMPYTMGHHEMDPSYAAGPSNSPTTSQMYSTSSMHVGVQSSTDQKTDGSSPHLLDSSSPLNADVTNSSTSGRRPILDKPVVRRSYHPNPPSHRSEWVMWAGNVPSDATHDELWRFFNKTPDPPLEEKVIAGVLSIFLISRSSCAFVNFESEHYLHAAIERFNGQPLRPLDPRCPRLVCRVRRKDDDLKAGVGGQRGMGMHTRWVKDQKGKGPESSDVSETSTSDGRPSTASSDQLAPPMSSLSLSSDEEGRQHHTVRHSSSSGSYTSTNSSVLSRYFPKRFFILKSLTQVCNHLAGKYVTLFILCMNSLIWTLVLRRGFGQRRSTMKGFWTRRFAQVNRCTSYSASTRAGNFMGMLGASSIHTAESGPNKTQF